MTERMPPPISQHIVPKFYLTGFTDPELEKMDQSMLWVYRLNNNPFKSAPENAAIVKNFYTYEHEGDRIFDVEEALEKIESSAAPILREKLGTGNLSLSAKERSEFTNFISLMVTRVPFFHETTDKIASHMETYLLENAAENDKMLKMMAEHFQRETGKTVTAGDLLKVLEPLRTGEIPLDQRSRAWSLNQMFQDSIHLSQIIDKMSWILFKSDVDSVFLTSDNPVALLDPVKPQPERQGFELSLSANFTFPINKAFCLYGQLGVKGGIQELTPFDVRQLNKRAIAGAYENVYAPNFSQELRKVVDDLLGQRPKEVWKRLESIKDTGEGGDVSRS